MNVVFKAVIHPPVVYCLAYRAENLARLDSLISSVGPPKDTLGAVVPLGAIL